MSFNLKLSIPESLAEEAEEAGLFSSKAIEILLRPELNQQRVERFFKVADRLAAIEIKQLTQTEIEKEIQAARASHSNSR